MPRRDGRREFVWSALAFILGAIPINMLPLGGMAAMRSMGTSMMDVMAKPPNKAMMMPMMQAIHAFMRGYIPFVLLPAIIGLLVLWKNTGRNYPRLANRIGAGVTAGIIGSIGLDIVRLIGVHLGAFPGDMPTLMGQMITGEMGSSVSVLLAGYIYHAINGVTFGVMYTTLAGKAPWGWGVAWGLFFELGMMTLPPIPMMTGPFGVFGFWPWLFIVSLTAHVVFGAILGVLAYRWVRDRGTIFSLLSKAPEGTAVGGANAQAKAVSAPVR